VHDKLIPADPEDFKVVQIIEKVKEFNVVIIEE
jgi:hypothetical protein